MIPLRDTTPSNNYPVVNISLIGINIAVFIIQISQGSGFEMFAYYYGLVPARYFTEEISSYFSFGNKIFSMISFMFLHGGFWHLLGNMWSLYIFGDNVEDRLGHFRYLIFYLLCGIGSGITHMMFNLHSNIPVIGASGAIAGVMGAYFISYPQSKILTLIPIIFIPWFVEIPAFFFFGIWFFLQLINAAGSEGGVAGIAWWAHIGGFILGMVLLRLLIKIPVSNAGQKLHKATEKKKTNRLWVIGQDKTLDHADLYGDIVITPYEALAGTQKLINVPWGIRKRIFQVKIPSGIREGTTLRLKGLGKLNDEGNRGDLFLKVKLKF